MNTISRQLALAAAAAGLAAPAAAGADPDARGDRIDTVTILGQRADVADVTGSARIVDSEELSLFLQSDILRVLRAVPGVYVQEEDGFGLRPNIGIRGSGIDRSARIALLEDGVLIAPAPYAASSAYYFPTQRRMSAVEVLKGPSAIAVGPRTTGGAVNLVSTPVPTAGFAGRFDARGGDHGTIDALVNVGHGGERISWLVETVQAGSDGFKTIEGPVGGPTGFDIEDYVAKFELNSAPGSEVYHGLKLKLGYTEQNSDETYLGLTDDDFGLTPFNRYAATANDNFQSEHEQYQATYVIDPGNSWRGEVTAYRNDFQRNWYKLQSVGGQGLDNVLTSPDAFQDELGWLKGTTSPDDALQIRANNRTYYSQGLQGRVEWDLGFGDTEVGLNAGFRLHEDEEDRFQKQDGYRMQDGALVLTTAAAAGSQANRVSNAEARSVFIDAEVRSGAWIVTPGVRYEDIDMTRLDYSTADPDRGDGPTRVRRSSVSVFIPGLGALYRLNDDWRLLAGVHRGYNPPAPGSSADAETSVNFEAGTRYDRDSLSFEALYFLNDYDNLVGTVTESTGGGGEIGDQFDGGEAVVQGLELSAAYRFAGSSFEIPIDLRYTWTTEAEFRNGFDSNFGPWGDVTSGDALPYIPEHQFRVQSGIAMSQFNLNVAANYVGRMRTAAGQGSFPAGETVESHVVWDLLGSWQFTEQLSAYVKVDNLLDETYVASRRPAGARPGLPRTGYVGINFNLN